MILGSGVPANCGHDVGRVGTLCGQKRIRVGRGVRVCWPLPCLEQRHGPPRAGGTQDTVAEASQVPGNASLPVGALWALVPPCLVSHPIRPESEILKPSTKPRCIVQGGRGGTCAEPFTEALPFSPMLPFVLETSREELGRYLSLRETVGRGHSSGGAPSGVFSLESLFCSRRSTGRPMTTTRGALTPMR